MSNSKKLDPRGRDRGRHQRPASPAGDPRRVGMKILAAGALGSAAVMAMQAGASVVAAPPAATNATLTANINGSIGLPASGGGGASANNGFSGGPTMVNGLDIGSLQRLPTVTPTFGNPGFAAGVVVPLGGGDPFGVFNFSFLPEIGNRPDTGGAINLFATTNQFQPTFTIDQLGAVNKPTLNDLINDDPSLQGLINSVNAMQFNALETSTAIAQLGPGSQTPQTDGLGLDQLAATPSPIAGFNGLDLANASAFSALETSTANIPLNFSSTNSPTTENVLSGTFASSNILPGSFGTDVTLQQGQGLIPSGFQNVPTGGLSTADIASTPNPAFKFAGVDPTTITPATNPAPTAPATPPTAPAAPGGSGSGGSGSGDGSQPQTQLASVQPPPAPDDQMGPADPNGGVGGGGNGTGAGTGTA